MKILIASLIGMITATQAIPEHIISDVAKMGPTAVLGAVLLIIVIKVLPGKDKEFTSTVRDISSQAHDDSVKLNETLTEMKSACAIVQASITK